jgi:hypothetical protein
MYNETIEATVFLEYGHWGRNTFTFQVLCRQYYLLFFKELTAYIGKIRTFVYIEHFWIHLKVPNLHRRRTYGNNFTLQKFNCALLLLLLAVQGYSSVSKNRWSSWKAGAYHLNDNEIDVEQLVSCH